MNEELDIKVVLVMLRKRLVWIIFAAAVGLILGFAISHFLLDDVYTSSTTIYISNVDGYQVEKVSATDLTASKSMANTYRYILASKRAQDTLERKLRENENFDNAYLGTYTLTTGAVGDTEIIRIVVASPDPKISAIVCNTMVDVSAELVSEIFDSGRSNSLGEAVPVYTPSSPNVRNNMLLGALVGLVIAFAIVFLIFYFDNRVKDEEDFVSKIGIPVLGEVPSVNEASARKDGYYAYYKKQDN